MRASRRIPPNPQVFLVRNAMRTPDGTILVSQYPHDYVCYRDHVSHRTYMVDGGLDYVRRSHHGDEVDCCVYAGHDPHEVVRHVAKWGTYGPQGDQPLKYVPVADMDTSHIQAVLKTCQPSPGIRLAMEQELKERR